MPSYTRAWHPSPNVILAAVQRLHEIGSVLTNKHDTGRLREARNLRNTERLFVLSNKNLKPVSRSLLENMISYSTVQKILKKEKLHAFPYTRVQHLLSEDYSQRKKFCESTRLVHCNSSTIVLCVLERTFLQTLSIVN